MTWLFVVEKGVLDKLPEVVGRMVGVRLDAEDL